MKVGLLLNLSLTGQLDKFQSKAIVGKGLSIKFFIGNLQPSFAQGTC